MRSALRRPRRLAGRFLAGLLTLGPAACGATGDTTGDPSSAAGSGGARAEQTVAPVAPVTVTPVTPDAQGFYTSPTRGGMFTIAWRPVPSPIPTNEPFELEVLVYRGLGTDEPVAGAELYVNAWMPDHGHGMVREPRATEVEPGRYRVRGMLLHMDGHWEMFFDVVEAGLSERADFEVDLG